MNRFRLSPLSESLLASVFAFFATGLFAPLSAQVNPIYPYVVPQTADPLLTNLTIPATAATQGMWSATMPWPLVGLHLTVLPDGRILSFGTPSGQGVQDGRTLDLWDPRQGFTAASHLAISNGQMVDSFCGTATMLPTGQALLSGGGSAGDGYQSFKSTIVNAGPSTAAASAASLASQRWYSTMTTLADGRALITGGGTPYAIVSAYANPSGSEANISETPEVYTPGSGWTSLLGARSTDAFGPINNRAWYPRQWVAPDGNVFGISTDMMWSLNPSGSGSITTLGTFKTTVDPNLLPNVGPTSTALMYDTGKIMQMGGNGYNNGYASPSSPYATIFDITNSGAPVITEATKMNYARQWASSTVLPNGIVLVTGGTTYGDNAGTNAVYPAELWNPATGTWTVGASAGNYRGYHSAAALLPDGVILSTGGGVPGPVTNFNAEIYYPPYLFTTTNGTATLAIRPKVISLSTSAPDVGTAVLAQMADTNQITEVSLIGMSSVTHSFNTFQRRLKLNFSQSGAQLSITMPNSTNLAPPGYYLLSMLNANRVPSAGVIVAFHAAAPPQSTTTATLSLDAAVRSFESVSHPGYVIRHQNYVAYLNAISPTGATLDRDDSSFYTRSGLANTACYSFEAKNFPGYFLRNNAFQVVLNQNDKSSSFAQDATFCAVAGLSGTGFSLQSYNYPTRYVHSRNLQMYIDAPDGTTTFAADASFFQTEQYLPVDGNLYSFGNLTAFNELVRHANYIGYVSSINSASTAGDIADASFYVRAGNASASCYSFEASALPGRFLRIYNGGIKLDASDGSEASPATFASDSTFCLGGGLAGQGFSLTSYAQPTYYLRQSQGTLYVNANDGTTSFPTDATFTLNPSPGVLFSLSAASSSVAVNQGQSNTAQLTITPLNGFGGTVTYSVTGLPAGATYTIQPSASGANITFTTAANTPTGSYAIIITATSGAAKAVTTVILTVATAGTSLAPTTTPPSTATVCAVDYGTCTIPANSTATVWYGAGAVWKAFASRSGSFICLPSTFGIQDPVPNVQKSCLLVFDPPPSTATVCAVDYGTCTVPANSTATLWYGVGTVWKVFPSRSGSFTCLPGTFGIQDPVPNVQKSCQLVFNPPPSTATVCAVDFGTCAIPANNTATLWYGAGTVWNVFASRSGSFTCLPGTFGVADPVPGVQKSCQVVLNGASATASAVVSQTSYFNVSGIGTIGTAPSNGGLDSSGYAYATSTIGTQASYGGLVFTLEPANAAGAVRGGTARLPAGSYTSLYAATGYGPDNEPGVHGEGLGRHDQQLHAERERLGHSGRVCRRRRCFSQPTV